MTRILFVDDDPVVLQTVSYSLKKEGYEVIAAENGQDALESFGPSKPDLVILDIMMPGIDGIEVCRLLRQTSRVPIIMLTARGEELDRILGLETGADDYLPKPFSFRELLAHIRALLRRVVMDHQPTKSGLISIGNITMDQSARVVTKNHRDIALSLREFDLLRFLMNESGRACSRQELMDNVWGNGWDGKAQTLEVHIRWLRIKVEDDPTNPKYIQTVRGYGYRFVSPEEL